MLFRRSRAAHRLPCIATAPFALAAAPAVAEESDCQVRMQRVGALLVEDNGFCGGSMVTFTGLYRRKR